MSHAFPYWPAVFVAFHLIALFSSVLIRRCSELNCRIWLHRAFFGLLVVVGAITMWSVGSGNSTWIYSAATFAVMSVGATLDLGQAGVASF